VPSRLKLPLALSLVAVVALLFYMSSGVREGLLTLLIGGPSLLLGVLAAHRGGRADEGEATSHPDTRPFETLQETSNGSAPAGTLLEATMNGMCEGVLVVNEHLRVVSANNAARSIFVYGGEAFAGQPLSALTRNPAINAAYRAAVERREDTQAKVELGSRELGGTGLGLAIVKHLARAHGGEVGVRSTRATATSLLTSSPTDMCL
jgi:PAS domain-containing protein